MEEECFVMCAIRTTNRCKVHVEFKKEVHKYISTDGNASEMARNGSRMAEGSPKTFWRITKLV
jgi:hypothetical protein